MENVMKILQQLTSAKATALLPKMNSEDLDQTVKNLGGV